MKRLLFFGFLFVTCLAQNSFADDKPVIRVGSKSFTESYILGEIFAQILEEVGEARVERHFGLGQTGIAFEAIKNNKIDLYAEYTGTIAEAILKQANLSEIGEIRKKLEMIDLTIGAALGFNNTYALGIRKELADKNSIRKISDLKNFSNLPAGLSHEFIEREDCYPKVKRVYGFEFSQLQALSHALAYEAIKRGQIDITDLFSTDAKITKLNLAVLEDDRGTFPKYLAVILARKDVAQRFPRSWAALQKLQNRISEKQIVQLNSQAEIELKSFPEIAQFFLKGNSNTETHRSLWNSLWELTKQHLTLVGISLLASILVGVPLALLAAEYRTLGQLILIVSGLLQTIPSLALLCFLIPVFGIGTIPSLVALFLYGLLPIVRGSYVGMTSLDPKHLEVADAMGLSRFQRLRLIELPLASASILGGIKTSAIINVGTATLAALIGAGGYGVPIVTGLALNDIPTILEGAIPAALMALSVHAIFELLDRVLIPKGIR